MSTWLVKVTLKVLPVPHPFWYVTLMVACIEKIEEQVNPVDRPLFATVLPIVGVTPEPAWGGPSAGGVLAVPPNCRSVPAVFTTAGVNTPPGPARFRGGPSPPFVKIGKSGARGGPGHVILTKAGG